MGGPVEIAGVDDDAADRGAVTTDVLRGGMHGHIDAVLEDLAQVRRGRGVVDDEWQALSVGCV